VAVADFLAPDVATGSQGVCIYDGNGQVVLNGTANASCDGAGCWRAAAGGYTYHDPAGQADGLERIELRAGPPEGSEAFVKIKGKGIGLAFGVAGPLALPVRTVFTASAITGGFPTYDEEFRCCEASFAARVRRNTGTIFDARSDGWPLTAACCRRSGIREGGCMADDGEMVLRIGLAAAVADGRTDERELAQLRSVAERYGVDPLALATTGPALPADIATRLATGEGRQAAYELAVAVCNADGAANEAEGRFLAGLRTTLGVPDAVAEGLQRDAAALANAPLATPAGRGTEPVDDLILQQAKLAAALELLPQSLASLAIIPLQMRLVYRIGQAHGQALDAAQVKDLLGTLGIGMGAQVVDGMARRIVGGIAKGLLGRALGGLTGGVAGMATGAATAFATTYALGRAAAQYYAQGRRLDLADLHSLFARLKDEAAARYPQLRGEIEAQAKTLDVRQIVSSLGGGSRTP
jgi:uncharacterized protein (DUF697 family)/tellurite resistance protein